MDLSDYIQTYSNLRPFPSIPMQELVEASVLEIFNKLKTSHIPYFCTRTILYEGNRNWDRMLYICDDEIPLIAFYSSNPFGDTAFVDCYGNLFDNELKLIQSFNHKKYYKYYNVKKIFAIRPFASDEEYIKCLAQNFRMLGCTKIPKMMKKFYEMFGAENAVKALKMIKNYYRVFIQLIRNFDSIAEFKIGDSEEILVIKIYETKREIETIIEVNMKKLSNEAAYISFTKLMWRLNLENGGEQNEKKETVAEVLRVSSTQSAFPGGIQQIDKNETIAESISLPQSSVSDADEQSDKKPIVVASPDPLPKPVYSNDGGQITRDLVSEDSFISLQQSSFSNANEQEAVVKALPVSLAQLDVQKKIMKLQ
uniref:Uncharacterized protein n=1 Tax=Panagrolaimus davidi TaxID=227884 RepID=A0A914PHW5_9BILA